MRKIHIGFTGTQTGMTEDQLSKVESIFKFLGTKNISLIFHHGCCIGADIEAANIFRNIFPDNLIVQHPPTNMFKSNITKTGNTEVRESKSYLVRNHCIVDESDFMIATPKEIEEQLRSGTWATIRYTRKKSKPLKILRP